MKLFRRTPLPIGVQGEKLAAKKLRRSGYRILERNIHLGRYEIDIIAQLGDTVVFLEVKTRRSADVASPEENVTTEKQRRIIAAARAYIDRRNDPELYYRFDVASVLIPESGKPTITIYCDAFQDK